MKKFKDLSIKTKLIGIQLLTTSVVLIFLGIFVIYQEWKEYQNSAINQLTSAAQLLSANSISSMQFLDVIAADEVLASLETQSDIVYAWIYDHENKLFAKYIKNGFNKQSFTQIEQEGIQFSEGYITISKKIIFEEEFLGMLSICLDMAERWNSLLHNIYNVILALLAGLITAFFFAVIAQKKISGPIIELTDKSEQVTKTGDYSIRIQKESSDEIGYLGSAFNKMLKQTQIREEELHSAREKLQTVLDTVPGTISWIDSNLNYLGVNLRLADLFKLKPEDFVGQPLGFLGSSIEFVNFVKDFFKSEKKQIYKEINSTSDGKAHTHLIIGQKYLQGQAAVFVGIDITKMKEAEKALKESEERFSLVMEASNTGIWDYDILKNSVYYSPRWKALIGYKDNELENNTEEWENRLHSDDKERILKKVNEYIAHPEGHLVTEYRLRHKDGTFRWILNRSAALINENGKPYRMLGSHLDITERKLAEEELRLSEDKFSKAFHSSPDMIGIASIEESRFVEINDAFVRIMEYSRKEVIGKTALDLNIWLDPNLRSEFIQTLKLKGIINNYEIEYRNKSGKIITCTISAEPIVFNNEDCFVFVARDISEQMKALEERAALNNLTNQLTASLTIHKLAKIMANSCRQLIKHDAFMFDLYDESSGFYTSIYCEDTPLEATKPVEIKLSKDKTKPHAVKGIFKGKKLLINKKSTEYVKDLTHWGITDRSSLSLMYAPVNWEDKCIGVISAQSYQEKKYNDRDLDLLQVLADHCSAALARVRAADELQEAHDNLEVKVAERTKKLADANVRLQELDRLKSMFLASMSHELRTPLNSIIGFTGLLLMGMAGNLNTEQKKQLGLVKNSANHLLNLINDILDISKIEAGKINLDINEFKLEKLINEIIDEASPLIIGDNLQLTSKVADNINITSDRRRIKQVVMNLVSNSIKFTESGFVKIITEKKSNGNIKIAVTDTGIGITKENINKLFKPFQQLDMSSSKKYEGTGLGLHLCRKLAELLGGEMDVDSEYGKGSTFTFTFPIIYKTKG